MKKGFTLIELLIVMGVVAILIAIVIPSFRGMQDEARMTRAQKECESLQAAVEGYYKNYNSYPANLSYLVWVTPKIVEGDILPTDPFRTMNYTYTPKGGTAYPVQTYTYAQGTDKMYGDWYMLGSAGPNRTLDTGTQYSIGTWFIAGDDIVITNANKKRI